MSGITGHSCVAPRAARGFTLIELMIVVALVAILSAIAYPAYQESVRRGHRTSAKTALLDLAGREERYYATNNVYSADLKTMLGYGVDTTVPVPDATAEYYDMTVTVPADSSTFTGSAAPHGDQAKDSCGSYGILSTGLKTNTGNATSTGDCWK